MDATVDLEQLKNQIKNAPLRLIAERIRAARPEGVSHDTIGERMGGVTRQHLIKLEQGKHRPGPEMLLRYAAATAKPVDFFLVEEAQEPESFSDRAA